MGNVDYSAISNYQCMYFSKLLMFTVTLFFHWQLWDICYIVPHTPTRVQLVYVIPCWLTSGILFNECFALFDFMLFNGRINSDIVPESIRWFVPFSVTHNFIDLKSRAKATHGRQFRHGLFVITFYMYLFRQYLSQWNTFAIIRNAFRWRTLRATPGLSKRLGHWPNLSRGSGYRGQHQGGTTL